MIGQIDEGSIVNFRTTILFLKTNLRTFHWSVLNLISYSATITSLPSAAVKQIAKPCKNNRRSHFQIIMI